MSSNGRSRSTLTSSSWVSGRCSCSGILLERLNQLTFVSRDTVGSIGFTYGLPFVTSPTFITTYRHAVSLDERRAKFQVNLWNEPTEEEKGLGLPSSWTKAKPPTDIKEVWFAGCHCGTSIIRQFDHCSDGCSFPLDVGGGSVSNRTDYSLARIPLRWMVREIFRANAGILFLADRLPEIGLDPKTVYPVVLPRPKNLDAKEHTLEDFPPSHKENPIRPSWYSFWRHHKLEDGDLERRRAMLASEEHEELKDALSPVYDQMELKWWWKILEWTPLLLRRQWKNGEWATRLW